MPFNYSDDYCFACGKKNPIGLKLDVKTGEGRAWAEFVPRKEFEGYHGYLHGGIIATLLDEVMVYAAHTVKIPSLTAELTVRYKKPALIGSRLLIEGKVVQNRGRLIRTEGTIKDESGELIATARATYMHIPE